jgi:predicted glycosyltransferase
MIPKVDVVPRMDRCRVALYSHDTMGIGHMRRNLQIAQLLRQSPCDATVLLVAGARAAAAFSTLCHIDCVTLPALSKLGNGHYRSRSLDLPLEQLIGMRSKVIRSAIEAFSPDVLIVDNVPRGAVRELDSTLEYLRASSRCRMVLGLRDVLDDPDSVQREWRRAENEAAICEFYDAVWVYGDARVFDLAAEYQWSPEVAAKLHYTGYLDYRLWPEMVDHAVTEVLCLADQSEDRLILCMVGGGEDGSQLAEAFAQVDFPAGSLGVILMGPYMPLESQRRLQARAAAHPRLRVLEAVTDPDLLLSCADRVVSMGGYNSTYEVLSFEKPALIVPRVSPRREQFIRAERLCQLGLLDVLPPDQATPQALAEWIARDLRQSQPPRQLIDMNGAARLPRLLLELLNQSGSVAAFQPPQEQVACASPTY